MREWKLAEVRYNLVRTQQYEVAVLPIGATEPHGLRLATSRFLFSSFSLDIYLRRAARRVRVPTLLILGEHDRIISNAQTRLFAGRFDTAATILDYPGAHHTLEFEPAGHPWVTDVGGWIEQRVVGKA